MECKLSCWNDVWMLGDIAIKNWSWWLHYHTFQSFLGIRLNILSVFSCRVCYSSVASDPVLVLYKYSEILYAGFRCFHSDSRSTTKSYLFLAWYINTYPGFLYDCTMYRKHWMYKKLYCFISLLYIRLLISTDVFIFLLILQTWECILCSLWSI